MSNAEHPWLSRYEDGQPHSITADRPDMLSLWREAVKAAPDDTAVLWFDRALSWKEIDERSDTLAVFLQESGFAEGDRLALYLQNHPAFLIGLVAAWKAGGCGVAINPMSKARELTYLLGDSGAVAVLCHDELYDQVVAGVVEGGQTSVRTVVSVNPLDEQSRDDERLFADVRRGDAPEGTTALSRIIEEYAGREPRTRTPSPDDIAVLTYTSGTTGVPKGAMNTHANMAFNSSTYLRWMKLTSEDRVLGIAPLFHITGLVGHVGAAIAARCPLVLAYRFEPNVVLDTLREHRPTFTIGSITVFIALSSTPGVSKDDFSSFRLIYSGGAPIAPAVTDRFEKLSGHYIHNAYGLTETNSPTHCVPAGSRAPVDEDSGALSVGVPVYDTVVRIVGENGEELAPGEVGEICSSGPQVIPGYWNKPEATAESLPGGELRTGDVGFMDADGWFYIVDRKKDMINASGYKVWPREVEDVLYTHPDVREVAVVGVPDEYRGESVKAYVSLNDGSSTTPEELVQFCKERMAAYKYPRHVDLMDELPKTTTGKILRRQLRDDAKTGSAASQ
ncbi:long-chain fatty acid--CoA ligase [Yimella sp. NH-Cas1]|uniref:long-chain-fatty-acid--CoA ligase n=1 Tax=Yimella sp. NH-Cas1 TaxID=2917726 RepID=UPI001EFAA4C5|nr:long-chain fatty acid--CoA ligase [Yimella sp. NH-Cas1]MCG8656000.1 long-chain fatty acid--CoA ligase [Yimella sp. NH-Cas1]